MNENSTHGNDRMTVGALRSVIAGMADKDPVVPVWNEGQDPQASDPAVEMFGFECRSQRDGTPVLAALVGIRYLDDLDDDPEDGNDFGPCPYPKCQGRMNGGGYCTNPGYRSSEDEEP
jgi:hypothetical protein